MITIENIPEIAEETKQEKGKPKAYKYFTFIWYPAEREKLFQRGNDKLYNLGFFTMSPLHNGVENQHLIGGKKTHFHVLCKCTNKMTANAFIMALCDALGNDLTGVAINKKDIGVENVELMLRYFLHLNNPVKEKFDLLDFLVKCDIPFASEYSKAFQTEIQVFVQAFICSSGATEFQEVLGCLGSSNIIITEWLNQRKHMQLVYNMLNDNRKEQKERERKEWNTRQDTKRRLR